MSDKTKALRDAVVFAMKCDDLWLPKKQPGGKVPDAVALYVMREKFRTALALNQPTPAPEAER